MVSASQSRLKLDWFVALYEEDCLKIRELLHKEPGLVIVHAGDEERQTLRDIGVGWRGCTALHVAVKKGWPLLVKEILEVFDHGHSQPKCPECVSIHEQSMESLSGEIAELLLAFDVDCQLDVVAIAIASHSLEIIQLLAAAFLKCRYDPYGFKLGWNPAGTRLATEDEDCNREQLREVVRKVIADLAGSDVELVTRYFNGHTDFNFLPMEDYLFHAVCAGENWRDQLSNGRWRERIAAEALARGDSLFIFLFELRDAQGRTPLHVAVDYDTLASVLDLIPGHRPWGWYGVPGEYGQCLNARDSVGRTALHRAAVLDVPVSIENLLIDERTDLNALVLYDTSQVRALDYENLSFRNGYVWTSSKEGMKSFHTQPGGSWPLLLAAVTPNLSILRELVQNDRLADEYPEAMWVAYEALHVAAASGNAAAVEAILGSKKLGARTMEAMDHWVVINDSLRWALHSGSNPMVSELGPYLEAFNCRVSERSRVRRCPRPASTGSEQERRAMSRESERQACINVLTQAGADVFKRNEYGLLPTTGPDASPEMQLWWSQRVAQESRDVNSSLASAANAVSVTAALVATAAFIGPLQPPMGYGTSSDGLAEQMQLRVLQVRVFFVSNTLAFYSALGAIMLSLIPSLPFPNECMEVERKRTRLSVVLAISLLMASMLLILVAFTMGCIAVVSNDGSWHHGASTKRALIIGGVLALGITCWCCVRIVRLILLMYKTVLWKIVSILETIFLYPLYWVCGYSRLAWAKDKFLSG